MAWFRRAWAGLASGCLVSCTAASPSALREDAGIEAARMSMDDASAADVGPDRHDAHTPDATSLAVSTMLSLSLPLVPAFSPDIHDYYVRCPSESNAVDVTMQAATGSSIALARPVATTPAAHEKASFTVVADAAIVVDVVTGGATDEYWIRCLPPTFPKLDFTLHAGASAPSPGYYLISNGFLATGELGYAIVLDSHGVPVWYRSTPMAGVNDLEDLTPGVLSYIPRVAALTTKFELHDLGAGTVTYVGAVGLVTDHHELRHLPNGDYLVLTAPITSGVDLTGLSDFGPNERMIGCEIQEVDPSGNLVWKWSVTDHFDPVQDCTFPSVATLGMTQVPDPFHCNSVDVDVDGNLLVSSRHMDSVFFIDRVTGSVVWKMGGRSYSKDAGTKFITVMNDPMTSFHRQHDARLLPDGTLSMFDDETKLPGPARGVVYSYDVDAGTASLVWEHRGLAPSNGMGSLRMLADGSRLIGWGVSETPGRVFTELDADGNEVIDFYFPDGEISYRAVKLPTSALDLGVLRATAGMP